MAIILFRQSLDLGNMRNFIFRYTLFIPILRASLAAQMIKICLQCGRLGFKPRVGKISWRTEWQPPPVFLPGEFHRQRSLAGYSSWGRKELDATKRLTTPFSISDQIPRPPHSSIPQVMADHPGLPSARILLDQFSQTPSLPLKLTLRNFSFFSPFWLCHLACGILVTPPGIEPKSPALEPL